MLSRFDKKVKSVYGIVFVVALLCLGFSLVLEYGWGLEPCVMCMLQRLAIFVITLFALLGYLSQGRWLQGASLALMLLTAGLGLYVAVKQTWLQWYPPEFAACGRDFYGMWETVPLGELFINALGGSSDCAAVDWSFLGLSLANYGVLFFAAVLLLALGLVIAKFKQ